MTSPVKLLSFPLIQLCNYVCQCPLDSWDNYCKEQDAIKKKTRKLLTLLGAVEFEFEWGFTPCRHLRPSLGREHTIV